MSDIPDASDPFSEGRYPRSAKYIFEVYRTSTSPFCLGGNTAAVSHVLPSPARKEQELENGFRVTQPCQTSFACLQEMGIDRDFGYRISEASLGQPRHIRIVGVGAGASGINLAKQLDSQTQNVEYVIYEKNAEIGGTWFENKYAAYYLFRTADLEALSMTRNSIVFCG